MYFGEKYLTEKVLLEEAYKDFLYKGHIGKLDAIVNEQEFIDILNEKMDMDEGFGAKLRPVFIILLYSDSAFDHVVEKFCKGQEYWHAAISFGPALSHCYSFNFGEAAANRVKGGLSFESLKFYQEEHPTGTMQVGAVFLTEEKYNKVKEAMYWYFSNKQKTKYSFINLLYSWRGKPTKNGLNFSLVCSTFVDTLLKYANINLNQKQTNLVKPDDLKHTDDRIYFKVFDGNIVDYNANEVREKSEKLANRVSNDYFRKAKDEKLEDIVLKKKQEKKEKKKKAKE